MRVTFRPRNQALWAGLLLVVVGAMFVIFSWMLIVQERQYQQEGRTVDGVVLTKAITRATRRDSDGSRRNETEYSVTYRFTAADGRTYEGNQHVAIEVWDRLQEREPVSVQYLASNPSTNRLASEQGGGLEYIFGGVGAVVLLIGLVLLGGLVLQKSTVRRVAA